MPRAMGNATIAFGLVSAPVQIYSAADTTNSVSFNMLHKGCGSRLRQQYICETHKTAVDREHTSKGYEFSKDRYLEFLPEELKVLEETGSGLIDIVEFVPRDQIPDTFRNKAYYLGPGKGGSKAYALIREAMDATGLAAIGKYGSRGKQYLVMLVPMDNVILMEQLHYADEVRDVNEIQISNDPVSDKELELAVHLVQQLASDHFDPTQYRDEVRERVLTLINQKLSGEPIPAEVAQPQSNQLVDMVKALQESIQAAQKNKPAHKVTRKAAKGLADVI